MENYTIIKELHKGDLSCVWRVTRNETGGTFLIKRVSELMRDGPVALQREAEVLCQLDHPNLVRYLDCFYEKKHLYLVMEELHGGTLQQRLEEYNTEMALQSRPAVLGAKWPVYPPLQPKRFSEAEVLMLFAPLAKAVAYLHENGLVHGNIASRNIFFEPVDGIVKLGDFGFHRVVQLKMLTVTPSNHYFDNILYMSPEFLKYGRRTPENDVWSLGCVLFEIMMGKPPFDGSLHRDLKDVINKVEIPVIPAETGYSKELRGLVQQLLLFDAKDRITMKRVTALAFLKPVLFPLQDEWVEGEGARESC